MITFKQWGTVFPGAACVAALVDRFTQHCHKLLINADSWRETDPFDHDAEKPTDPKRPRKRRWHARYDDDMGPLKPSVRWLKAHWDEEDVLFFFEADEDGWVLRQVELRGPDRVLETQEPKWSRKRP